MAYLGTTAYIKETGDFHILEVEVPFDHDPENTGTYLSISNALSIM